MKRTGCILGVLLAVAVVAGIALLAEGGGRWYVRQYERELMVASVHLNWTRCHQYDPDLMWALRPNLVDVPQAYSFKGKMQEWTVCTNAQGLRNPPLSPKNGRYRILVLGDSRTYGLGVGDTETWTHYAQAAFDAKQAGSVDVVNAGVSGYASFQGLQYLRREGPKLEPDMVVACFGYNDAAQIPDPGIGDCDWENPRASRFAFITVLKNAIQNVGLGRVPVFSPRTSRLRPGEFLDCMVEMKQWCDVHGATLVLLAWPALSELIGDELNQRHYGSVVLAAGKVTRAPVIDVSDTLDAHIERIFLDDIHLNPEGNRLIAEYTVETIGKMYTGGPLSAMEKRPAFTSPPRPPEVNVTAEMTRYRRWITADPSCFLPYDKLDQILIRQGDPSMRIREWRAIADSYPDSPRPVFYLGHALLDGGDVDGAIGAYERAVALEPEDAAKHASLGRAYTEKRDFPKAVAALNEAVRLAPDTPYIRHQLIYALTQSGDYAGAQAQVHTCEQMLIDLPEGLAALVQRGLRGDTETKNGAGPPGPY